MDRALDICLVSPPTRAASTTVPSASLYLDAWLKKCQFASRIVDPKTTSPDALDATQLARVSARIIREVAELTPRFVGIPCCTAEYSHVIDLARRLRKEVGCRIVVGGVHPSLYPGDFFFDGSPIDFAVVGDGQEPLLEILSLDSASERCRAGRGVACDVESAEEARGAPASFQRWEEMPTPDYTQLDMRHYTRPQTNVIRNLVLSGIHVFTTMGCPYRCTFCGNRNHKVTFRPIPLVLDELCMLRDKFKIDSFYVQDDTFLMKRARVFEFVAGLKDRKLDLLWALETRVNLFDDEIAASLAGSGCLQVDFGVESGSIDALKRMKKGITLEQIARAFDTCRRHGLRTFATFMFNTPGETDAEVEQTLQLMARIKATRTGVGLTVPYPGTEIYETYVKPPIGKDAYQLFGGDTAILTVSDSRFRMATHSRNLETLRNVTSARFNGIRMMVDYTLQPAYWRTTLQSARRFEYIKAWTGGTCNSIRSKVVRHSRVALRKGAELVADHRLGIDLRRLH